MLTKLLAAWALVMLIGASSAAAQDQQRTYRPNPADEDWSFLETAPRVDFWDRVKYIPLGRDHWFMTVSGEVRYRPEGLRVRETDNRPSAVDNYLLQRYLLGADVRFGTRARVFTEVQSGIVNGILRTPRPTDRNSVDLHQAFVELRPLVRGQHGLFVTVGRQELSVGSTRLISASPGLNVKRSFDGGAVSYRTPSWTVAGAVARLVRLTGGAFDDRWDTGQLFWGVAAGRRIPRFERGEMGAYYLGIDRAASLYVQALASESRHTVGVKWAGTNGRLDLNYDALFQWGSFGRSPIRAWAFATETGYRWTGRRWRPRISVRADIATGDRDRTDPRLQTFNPLFPGNSYSGAVGLLGPSNLTDMTPALTLSPWRRVTLAVEAPSYWRSSTGDGVYATDLRPIVLPDAGPGKYVGTNPGVIVVAQATRHLQLQGAVTRFLPGAFLKDSFVSSGFGFYSVSAVYRF